MELKNIDDLLKKYQSLKYNEEKTKLKCEWSGHELPLKVEAILNYVNGNKYKNLLKKNVNHDEFKKYLEFLVPSNKPNRENQYFCKLTLRHLNKQPDHIEKHLKGKRFQKAYKHWLYCQENNIEFVPFPKQHITKARPEEEDDDSERPDGYESDQMSDLFPEEMFDLIEPDEEDADVNESNGRIKKMNLNEKMDLNDEENESEEDENNNHCKQKREREFKPTKKSVQPKKKKKV